MSSKKKTTQNQTSTNTYGWQQNPGSQDINDLRENIKSGYDTPDSSIPYAFNQQRSQLMNRFDNPFGADYSPEVQDAARYSGMAELDQAQGQAYRDDAFQRKNAKIAAMGGLASQTAPQLVQLGGTSSGTSVQSTPFNFGSLINAGAGIGSAALI